jgi:hypothetical protein
MCSFQEGPVATFTFYGCYLSDLSYFLVENVPAGKTYSSGDIVKATRGAGTEPEFSVVLGVGGKCCEAKFPMPIVLHWLLTYQYS